MGLFRTYKGCLIRASISRKSRRKQKILKDCHKMHPRRRIKVMRDDLELLSDWALRADETAFRALVGRYAGLVHGVAARRTGGQHALAQEIGQNVFTMLARKAGSLRWHPCLASWLHRAAVLESAHLLRREFAHAKKLARLANHLETMFLPHAPPDATPPGPEIDDALARLSESDRAVLLMRFFEDRSYQEIAALSGQNEAATRKRVERALARLAPHLGITASAGALGAAGPLQAALGHAAPEGLAASAGTAALAGAPALTAAQLLLHSLKIMTLGKSAFLTTAVLLALITFGGSYAASRHVSGSLAMASAASAHDSLASDAASKAAAGRGKKTLLSPARNPGDSPARAALRERLQVIGRSLSVDLQQRSIQFSGFGLPSNDAMRAMGEFNTEDLVEAWKLLPDFRGKPREYKSIAAFLTSMRLEKDPPQEILRDLLAPEARVESGKPTSFAAHQALGGWFRQNSAAAWDWLRQAVPKGDFPADRRFNYGYDLVGDWLAKDPASALAAMNMAGPEWSGFRQAAFVKALETKEGQTRLWPVLEKTDDQTALLLSDSHLKESDWTRDTVLPWLLTRDWADGTEAERILHGWTWKEGELHEPGFGMLCESVGRLPDEAANAALLHSVRKVFDGITPDSRPALLERLVKDPARREALTVALAQ